MAARLAAAVSDPLMFAALLDHTSKREMQELYLRLNRRTGVFGSLLSRRDREAYDTLVWSRNEVGRRLSVHNNPR